RGPWDEPIPTPALCRSPSLAPLRHVLVARQIREAGDVAVELQLYGANGAVALLADDHLGPAADELHLGHPVLEFDRAFLRLQALQVILLPEHEHDNVGILLDGARLAQIRELWPLVLTVLDGTGELRQSNDGDVQLLGERFQAGGDLRNLLHAVVALVGSARHELQVVDDEETEALLALELTGSRRQLRDRKAAGLIYE